MNAPEMPRIGPIAASHWLSLGDHYHKIELSLVSNVIEVKKWKPKKELQVTENLIFHYRYRSARKTLEF